jgi:hypothetical protein
MPVSPNDRVGANVQRVIGIAVSTLKVLGFLVLTAVSAWGWTVASASNMPVAEDSRFQPMRFEWHTEGPDDQCANACRTWISAAGVISEDTARDFETFSNEHDVRDATLVLDSVGGSVVGALGLGTLIRRFNMTTTVGKTIVLPDDGGKPRARLSLATSCESMCAFLLLGGTRRYVPPEARVLVHQIWLHEKTARPLDASYTAEEIEIVQRDIGTIARYTIEMGGGIELLETALRIPPWKPMHELTAAEIRRMKLITVDRLFEQDVPSTALPNPPQPVPAAATRGSARD